MRGVDSIWVDVAARLKGDFVTCTGFETGVESPAGPRHEGLTLLLADELASCLRRFVEVTADDGTLARAERALAAWDRLARATGVDLVLPAEWVGSPAFSFNQSRGLRWTRCSC